ncbi:hypothetical protein V7S43_017923 [Phytophthora oleae]|uniref:Uncharacterized protein n=1 Tax=Phytophthora oleae TaxID=2107226 RepID=A0ABD3EVJ2_9STRA
MCIVDFALKMEMMSGLRSCGFHLGSRVDDIRSKGQFKAQIEKDEDKLARIKFCFNIAEREWDTRVLPPLRIYWQEFGNCDIPNKFEVPDCPPWQQDCVWA